MDKKKIFVLGLARSGYEVAKVLKKRDNEVLVVDENKNDEHIEELRELGITVVIESRQNQDQYLDETFNLVVKNPGAPLDVPVLKKAAALNIPVTNEVDIAYQLFPENVTLVGITGTNGKTTTTTLTYKILNKAFGDRVHLTGNIGYPLVSFLDKLKEKDIVVMEVSCQQLSHLEKFKPNISVMTNLSPAHTDFFGSYDAYKAVKQKIFQNQTEQDVAILNIENDEVMSISKDIKAKTKYFSSKDEINGCYLKNSMIYYYGEKIISVKEIFVKGIHNMENIMSAIMVAKEYNVDNETIIEVLKDFKGVEHRLEYIDTVKGVKYYNDTKATNIKSTQIALASFSEDTIVILGGLERQQDFNELTPFMGNVKAIIGIGECRDRVLEYGTNIQKPTFIYEFLKDGFKKCVEIAKEDDVILLSPSTASWDQYKKFEDRGDEFKKLVRALR